MTKPVGTAPQALVHLDETLLDAQCCADAQSTNTAAMLEAFGRIWADGRIDDQDASEICYLRRHTLLEHTLNEDQLSLLRWCRWSTNRMERVVRDLRTRIQEMRRAAVEAALQVPMQTQAHTQSK